MHELHGFANKRGWGEEEEEEEEEGGMRLIFSDSCDAVRVGRSAEGCTFMATSKQQPAATHDTRHHTRHMLNQPPNPAVSSSTDSSSDIFRRSSVRPFAICCYSSTGSGHE